MNLDTAHDAIGAEVLYRPRPNAHGQRGRIEAACTHPHHVMVRFSGDGLAKATPVAQLEFFHQLAAPLRLHLTTVGNGVCDNGNCSRSHNWIIECSCGRKFTRSRLKYSRLAAQAHQYGSEATS